MPDGAESLQVQQLLELLATLTSLSDESSAIQAAAERAAMALEAEVCAVIIDRAVIASVGCPAGAGPEYADLMAIARRERADLDVPGLGGCPAVTATWDGEHPGVLVLARGGDDPFTAAERNVVREPSPRTSAWR